MIANDATLGICAMRSSHARARIALRDTNGLQGMGMQRGGDRVRRAPHAGDVQRVLIDDRL